MATAKLEARSLSDINYLAANPPQYPHHPERKESLTLYISRVPGTQDIILSTFRPHKKSVTGEDITNSLYYIHLDSPEDDLLAAPQRLDDSRRSSSESARSAIPRKPLPASARVPHPVAPEPHTPASPPRPGFAPHVPGNIALAGRPTARSPEDMVEGYRENPMFRKRRSGTPSEMPMTAPPSTSAVRRKKVASRPTSPLINADVSAPLQPEPNYPERPVTPTQHRQHPAQAISPPSPLNPNRTPQLSKVGHRPSSASFSLTLIRRDPTSGSQWNVGKVSSFHTNVPTPDRADPNLDPENMGMPHAQRIDIQLATSGYAKYRDMPTRASVDAHRPTPGLPLAQQGCRPVTAGLEGDRAFALKPAWEPIHRPTEEGFTRQVFMSYGPSWTTNIKKAFHRRDRPISPETGGRRSPLQLAPPRPIHARQGSASTIDSVDSEGGHQPTLITEPGPGLKPKGYVFLSPWDGRCEFRTSTNGRALKCRHVLDATSMKVDPRDLAQNLREAQAMGRSRGDELSSALVGAKPVSELRFNLPNGDRSGASGRNHGAKGNRLSGQFGKLLHRHSLSSDDDDDEDYDGDENVPMDLSLGKENAGGGNRGTRAKLGKLVIHDEGLKMLDLVVAANIGVWWTTWGRAS